MAVSEATTRNDLAWLANCYVTGELSSEESASFEARLGTDESACEAVAQAMSLNLAVSAAFDQEASRPVVVSVQERHSLGRWATVSVAALAAAVIVVASIALMVGGSGTTPDGTLATNTLSRKDKAASLVAVWASGEAARNSAADEDFLESVEVADLDPPDWMIAAVTIENVDEQLTNDGDIRKN